MTVVFFFLMSIFYNRNLLSFKRSASPSKKIPNQSVSSLLAWDFFWYSVYRSHLIVCVQSPLRPLGVDQSY